MPTTCPTDCEPASSEFAYAACATPTLPENMFSFAASVATFAANGAASVGSTAEIVALIAS